MTNNDINLMGKGTPADLIPADMSGADLQGVPARTLLMQLALVALRYADAMASQHGYGSATHKVALTEANRIWAKILEAKP